MTSRYLGGIAQDAGLVERPSGSSAAPAGFARIGAPFPPRLLDWALRTTEHEAADGAAFFERHDVLLTPVTARPPVARANGRDAARCARCSE